MRCALIAVLLLLLPLGAVAYQSLVVRCPTCDWTGVTHLSSSQGSMAWQNNTCSAVTDPRNFPAQRCGTVQLYACSSGGAWRACNVDLTAGATPGPTDFVVNCPSCLDGWTGRFWLQRTAVAGQSTWNGCISGILGTTGCYAGYSALYGCDNNGSDPKPCDVALKPGGVDVTDVVNVLSMFWIGFALIAGLVFGWKSVQRRDSQ